MYFLRRRHGRKPHPEARREIPQPPVVTPDQMSEAEVENLAPPRPTVITKVRRQRNAEPAADDCKPAGTFRAGTLHIDRSAPSQERHEKA